MKIKAGILGGAGYTGGELIRILVHHPDVEISFVHSRSNADAFISDLHRDLLGDTYLQFTDCVDEEVDVIFLCLGHGESEKIIPTLSTKAKIIDLSQDFRLKNSKTKGFVYGLPELYRDQIKQAQNIANPGCFATSIQLALLPLAKEKLLKSTININATTGSTGAGQSFSATSHFSNRHGNLSVYKVFTHQHLLEINQNLKNVQEDFHEELVMIPQRGAFTRGILSCISLETELNLEEAKLLYKNYYQNHLFTHLSDQNIELKQVINTNKCLLYLEKHNKHLMVISIIDNLLKGASGQAVQNMNLMFGLQETAGLKLKANAF